MKEYKTIKKHNLLMFKYHIINNITGEITSSNYIKRLKECYLYNICDNFKIKTYKNKIFFIIDNQ